MSTEEVRTEDGRCRAKLTQNSKGYWQLEATAEFPTPAEASENLIDTLRKTRDLALERGYKLVDEV